MCGGVPVCAHVYVCLHRPEEGFRSPGARVAVDCKSPDMGAGIQALVVVVPDPPSTRAVGRCS